MADKQTRNTGASLPLLTLGFLCDVWWVVAQIFATSVECKIIWQLCSDGLALGLMVITSEPLQIAVLNFLQRRAISIATCLHHGAESFLERLTGFQLVKKFPAFHGTRRFITALTSLRHPPLSWASPIQSIYPHPTSWRSILILFTHLRLGLPSGFFPSGFLTKILYVPLSSPIRATCPAHLILLDFITRTILGEEYRSFNSSLCTLLHSPVTSSLLGPNILLNAIFSDTLSFFSSLIVSDQVSHPYKTIGKIIVLCILIFKFLDSNLEDKRFCTEW